MLLIHAGCAAEGLISLISPYIHLVLGILVPNMSWNFSSPRISLCTKACRVPTVLSLERPFTRLTSCGWITQDLIM